MSEENGKVCCNCRHNIRTGQGADIRCHCDMTGDYLGYVGVMTYWCRHWSRYKTETKVEEDGK